MKQKQFVIAVMLTFVIASISIAMPPLDGGWEPDYPPGVNTPDRGEVMRDDADIEGRWRCLIILVDFEDYPWDNQEDENFPNDDEIYTTDHYNEMLFSVDEYQHPGAESEFTGSMRDYYLEVSGGVFETIGMATCWYRAPEPLSYYCNYDGEEGTDDDHGLGAYPHNVQKLVEDVLELADDDVDFSEYDNDENGVIDGLFIVHAGPGAETQGRNPNYIWSHKWQIARQERDDVAISTYSMEPQDGAIGVFSHEYGHVLGLPDLYDTDYTSQGIGDWGIMSGGSWGHRPGDPPGTCPVHMCAWSKLQLDWADLHNITETTEDTEIPPVVGSNIIYRVWTNGDDSDEYFLVENRRQIGFDASLTTRQIRGELTAPEGLLITHIDDNLMRNDDELHRLVDIIEASPIYIDGQPRENLDGNLENRGENNLYNDHRGDNGDLWPGFSEHSEDSTEWTGDRDLDHFGSFSIPSSNGYDSRPSLVDVYDIRLDDENVICSFSVDADDEPFPAFSQYEIDDDEGGNDNGFIEPGERIELTLVIENIGGLEAENVVATLEYDGEYVDISDGEIEFGNIESGGTALSRTPFEFEVSEETPNVITLDFSLGITADEFESTIPLRLQARPPHEWFKHPDNPVLSGKNGGWNEDGIIATAVIVEGDTVKCWYVSGAEEEDPPVHGAIGAAWSVDGGLHWIQSVDPVLSPDPDIDWIWAYSGISVMSLGEQGYLMAFLAQDEDSVASIGIARSRNGQAWTIEEEPIINSGDGWMTELFYAGQLSLFAYGELTILAFSGTNQMGLCQIGMAFSDYWGQWEIDNSLILQPTMNANDFDAYFLISPDVTTTEQGSRVLYAGLGDEYTFSLGVAYTDGEEFTRHPGLEDYGAVLEPGGEGGWGEIHLLGGRLFDWQGETRMLFCGMNDDNASIGLALQYPVLSAPQDFDKTTLMPEIIFLDPAFPNPFNSSTTIKYHLGKSGFMQVMICDLSGRKVVQLAGGHQQAGQYTIGWNGETEDGISVSSGLYLVRLSGMNEVRIGKLLLVK
ncbi:MAG: M6 family metalloprotease domain-containing protein [Candidatus Hatepunaea meridiana]|nr:M6 family metalloprotease domain-containing protein [Candidatus Hatepunaea meridiana]